MLDMFVFSLKDRQDVMVAQYQKDGQVGPPPGACPLAAFPSENPPFAASLLVRYSPRLEKDLGTIQRLAPKNEGFGSVG